MNLREAILSRPMRRIQFGIIAICLLVTMIDGYDILVMAFVAPHLAKAWALGPVEVGYLLSAGVFGAALGAALISPLADRIGRRRHILLCLALIGVGMGLSAAATSVEMLAAFRAFAGLFIGAVVSSLNIMTSEYSPAKRRGTVMGIYGIGLPLGAAIGGALTNPLVVAYGWRGAFVLGAALTLVMFAVVWLALPESIEYLIERRPKDALAQYNRIADRFEHPRVAVLPAAVTPAQLQTRWNAIVGGAMLARTVFLWLGYAALVAAFYFANTWTAKLIADASGDPALGVRTGILILIGGVIGSLMFAALSLKVRPRLVTVLILFLGAVSYFLYANQFQNVGVALVVAVFVGMFANGGLAAFYAISPLVYPTAARGTGVGLMIGFGRGLAILAPIFTGYMLKSGWTPQIAYQFFGGALIVAGAATWLLDRTYSPVNGDV